MENKKINLNPFAIAGVVLGIVAVILLVVSLMKVFRTNPYGNEVRIDNLSDAYDNLPQKQKDMIFWQLYEMLDNNLADGVTIPESGAVVRDGSAEYSYDENTKVYEGDFIVDVPSLQQSYRVQFVWSPISDSQNLGGYSVVISCLEPELQIYQNDGCKELIERVVYWDNAYQLDYTFGANTSYEVRRRIEEFIKSTAVETFDLALHVDESTLVQLKDQPDLTFSFDVNTEDGAVFKVIVRMDLFYGDQYIAMYIDGGGEVGGIVITEDESLVDSLESWLKQVSGKAELTVSR